MLQGGSRTRGGRGGRRERRGSRDQGGARRGGGYPDSTDHCFVTCKVAPEPDEGEENHRDQRDDTYGMFSVIERDSGNASLPQ